MKLIFVFLAVVCQLVARTSGEGCKCVDEWTSRLRGKLAAFKLPLPTEEYEYTGVYEGQRQAYYKPCNCSDVTRVTTTMAIETTELYAQSATNVSLAVENITTTLTLMSDGIEASLQGELNWRFDRVEVTYKSRAAPKTVTFDLIFIIKGENDTFGTLLQNALEEITEDTTNNDHRLLFLGPYTLTTPTVVKCTDQPAAAPSADITREWTGSLIPPTKAIYKCPAGQFITPHGEGESTCQHDTLQWTTLSTISCTAGCGEDPPPRPLNAEWNWNDTERDIGHVVKYNCEYGFMSSYESNPTLSSGTGASSECTTSGWTALPRTYFCLEKPCPDPIPQVPSHSISNFLEEKRSAGEVVTYVCIPGYRSPSESTNNMKVRCSLGKWTTPTPGWKCINIKAINRADIVMSEMQIPEDELTKDELERKRAMATVPSYFWVVTVPSFGGLVLLAVVFITCTRTDSPLFHLCGGRKKDSVGYVDYMGSFGNN